MRYEGSLFLGCLFRQLAQSESTFKSREREAARLQRMADLSKESEEQAKAQVKEQSHIQRLPAIPSDLENRIQIPYRYGNSGVEYGIRSWHGMAYVFRWAFI